MSSLHPYASTLRALQTHVLDGATDIATQIAGSADAPVEFRLRVYADAYRLRLIEALEANYPVLAEALGEASFSRLAQEYLAIEPSHHFSIRWFGHRLVDFLTAHDDYRNRAWMVELAAWEWRTASAFDAADAELLSEQDLAAVPPESWPDLALRTHESVHRLRTTTNVHEMVRASAEDQPMPTAANLPAATEWLIWRRELNVQYRSVEEFEARALDAVIEGTSFAALCEILSGYFEEETVPMQAAMLIKSWLHEQLLVSSAR